MAKICWNNVRFIKSGITPDDYPSICNKFGTHVPQIAVVGRSNVGKSSLLNSLFSHKGMAKVSQTPGKTQTINFFCVDEALFCIDLPGYGFAKCPLQVKKSWDTMIQNFFTAKKAVKEPIALLLCLFDSRRMPNEEDNKLLEWARFYNIAHLIVVTKIDKLKKSEREKQLQAIRKSLALCDTPFVVHSSQTNEGRELLRTTIETTTFSGN